MAAPTSNIKGTFKDSQGVARSGIQISFEPLDTPIATGGDIVTGGRFNVTLSPAGKFGDVGDTVPYNVVYPLVKGKYRVVVSDTEAFIISVPGDGALWDIKDIAADVGTSEVLKLGVASATDIVSVVQDTFQITKSLKGDRSFFPLRTMFMGEGTIVAASSFIYNLYRAIMPGLGGYVVGLGNANGPAGAAGTIDANIGATFHARILGYSGAFGAGAVGTNRFYYALGPIDWTPGNVNAVTNFFQFPNNERYYKFTIPDGPLGTDVFVIDSNALEPDGNTQASVQGVWLQTQLAASTASRKIVCFRDAPISSKTGYSFPAMNWPFVAWGATLVVCAGCKFYERIDLGSGVFMIICGTTFNTHTGMDTFGTPVSGSLVRETKAGIFFLDTNQYKLTGRFVDIDGIVRDYFEIYGRDTDKMYFNFGIAENKGLTRGAAFGLDYGSAGNQVPKNPDTFIQSYAGHIVRVATGSMPTTIADPPFSNNWWMRSCLVLLGDDPGQLYYYNEADDSFKLLGHTTVWAGARTKLANPTLTPVQGSESLAVQIDHVDPAVQIWYSINGDPWVQMTDWPTNKLIFSSSYGNWWIAVVARKASRSPSDVVYETMTSPVVMGT